MRLLFGGLFGSYLSAGVVDISTLAFIVVDYTHAGWMDNFSAEGLCFGERMLASLLPRDERRRGYIGRRDGEHGDLRSRRLHWRQGTGRGVVWISW